MNKYSAMAIGATIGLMAQVIAGVVTTSSPGNVEMFNSAGQRLGVYPTKALCESALPVPTAAGIFEYRCKEVTNYQVRGTCDDVPQPPLPTVTIVNEHPAVFADPVNNEGQSDVFTDLGTYEARLCPGSDTEYCDVQTTQIRDDKLYPSCWKTELAPVVK